MNHNKNYFLLYRNAMTNNNGVYTLENFNLRNVLGHLYDEYRAFSIKLEGFVSGIALTTTISDDFLLLHLDGLPFFNGYDSCSLYNSSRVLEMVDYSTSSNRGYNFISNCNGINFYKPSTYTVTLRLFSTKLTDETILNPIEIQSYVLSITGIDAYKISHHKHNKIIIPRFVNMKTTSLILNTAKAASLDAKNRSWLFSNIDLRSMIGEDFYRYKKFALITRVCAVCDLDNGAYFPPGQEGLTGNILMSGFNWFKPSMAQYFVLGTTSQQTEIRNVHNGEPVCIIALVSPLGTINHPTSERTGNKETYIENVFEISKGTIDIRISNTNNLTYTLVPPNNTNAFRYPNFNIIFDIVPLT